MTTPLDNILKKMRCEVQERCAERLLKAQSMATGKINYEPKEERGTSYSMKKKYL